LFTYFSPVTSGMDRTTNAYQNETFDDQENRTFTYWMTVCVGAMPFLLPNHLHPYNEKVKYTKMVDWSLTAL